MNLYLLYYFLCLLLGSIESNIFGVSYLYDNANAYVHQQKLLSRFSKTERNVFCFSLYEILLTVFSSFTNRFRFSLLIVNSGFRSRKI